MTVTALHVPDMHCASCARSVEAALRQHAGITAAAINPVARRVFVTHDDDLSPITPFEIVERAGFHPMFVGDEVLEETDRGLLSRLGIAALLGMQIMMAAAAMYLAGETMSDPIKRLLSWTSLALATPIVTYAAYPFFAGALRALGRRRLAMDVPVALAIAVAFVVSGIATLRGGGEVYFDSIAMFTFLLLGARYLSSRLTTRLASQPGLRLLPEMAERLTNDGLETVPVSALACDDSILVRQGDRIPADAVVDGTADVDEALITGESTPVTKRAGDPVFAGALAVSALRATITGLGNDTRVAQIERLSAAADARRAPAVAFADRIAAVFVPSILLFAGATWGFWQWADPTRSFAAALAVLVVSCPCALSLAVPAAVNAALARLRARGAVVTDPGVVETLAKTTYVLIDKTGTVTGGEARLGAMEALGDVSADECLAYAAALERHANHPVARAFRSTPTRRAMLAAEDVMSLAGLGVSGTVGGRRVLMGNARAVGLDRDDGATYLALDGVPAARFEIETPLRSGAREAIELLRQLNVGLVMTSGDTPAACRRVAESLGIAYRHSETPEDKLRTLAEYRALGHVTMAVADGLNDIPLLAAADVAVVVLEAPETVRERANVILLARGLGVLPDLVATARGAVRVIRQNLAWALAYNLLAIPAAAAGWVPPWLAALGMSLSSIVVVANAARVLGTSSNSGQRASWRVSRELPSAQNALRVPEGHA